MKLTFLIWGQALLAVVALNVYGQAAECPSIFGIHDHEPDPGGYLDRLSSSVGCGWVTATVAIGHNPTDTSSADFSSLANRGHTVICRINNGYYPNGTIPATANYDNFAARCANFVARSQ